MRRAERTRKIALFMRSAEKRVTAIPGLTLQCPTAFVCPPMNEAYVSRSLEDLLLPEEAEPQVRLGAESVEV